MHIIGDVDANRLYCAGSFTKFLTSYVCLSLLAEHYSLPSILDDENFLDSCCHNQASREFLALFQRIIGSKFTLRDICTYYSGLPYTFDLSEDELARVEAGHSFKHHSIPDEETFLSRCKNNVTPVYKNRCKFHYSEVSILFFGYLIEKIYDVRIEDLYQKYVINKFNLKHSYFSRTRVKNTYIQDLSDQYDYPSIAILDHGYFCYSNGYYTTLQDTKILIENLLNEEVFLCMVDLTHARAASNRLLNGLTIEIRIVGDDVIYGYEGLSFSGCNIWAYSTKQKQGFLTFGNDEDAVYDIIYKNFCTMNFSRVSEKSQQFYESFIKHYHFSGESRDIPEEFRGNYHRVKINEKDLKDIFHVGKDFIVIRNPGEIKYDVIYVNSQYRIKCKDNVHGSKVGFYQASSGHRYMLFDGTLFKLL